MRVRFACPGCEATVASGEISLPDEVRCQQCGRTTSFARPTGSEGRIEKCPACGGPHLFLQKEFPRRLGLAIATVGAVLFLILMGFERIVAGFAALLGVALVDAIIYRLAPLMTVCYHCQTEFRRGPVNFDHGPYDPKIAFYTAKQGRPGQPVDAHREEEAGRAMRAAEVNDASLSPRELESREPPPSADSSGEPSRA